MDLEIRIIDFIFASPFTEKGILTIKTEDHMINLQITHIFEAPVTTGSALYFGYSK